MGAWLEMWRTLLRQETSAFSSSLSEGPRRSHKKGKRRCHDGIKKRCHDGTKKRCHDGTKRRCHDGTKRRCHEGTKRRCRGGATTVFGLLPREVATPMQPPVLKKEAKPFSPGGRVTWWNSVISKIRNPRTGKVKNVHTGRMKTGDKCSYQSS